MKAKQTTDWVATAVMCAYVYAGAVILFNIGRGLGWLQ